MACTAVTAGAGTLGCAALAGAVAGGINGAFNNCSNGATANQCVLGIATGAALGAATDVAFLGAGHLIGGIGGTAVSRLLRTEAGEAITARITASRLAPAPVVTVPAAASNVMPSSACRSRIVPPPLWAASP